MPYIRITPASIDGEIQDCRGLTTPANSLGGRSSGADRTYTVTTDVCSFDDAADGEETTPAAASALTAPRRATPDDKRPEDYRRVRVEVRWTHQRGRARGPSDRVDQQRGQQLARGAHIEPVGGATLTNDQVTSTSPPHTLVFDITTSTKPDDLHWLLDGRSQGPITDGAELELGFAWSIGVPDAEDSLVDGTYVVSAEAFDRYEAGGCCAVVDGGAQPHVRRQGQRPSRWSTPVTEPA